MERGEGRGEKGGERLMGRRRGRGEREEVRGKREYGRRETGYGRRERVEGIRETRGTGVRRGR